VCHTRRRSRWCVTSSFREWRIERASRAAVERHAESLAALDADLQEELGETYSGQPWTTREFLAERPAKWSLSRLAVQGDRPLGFWIASLLEGAAHTHRVGVSARWRGQGVATALAEEVHRAAFVAGARRMTMYVSPQNHLARAAYERLGYRDHLLKGRAGMERSLCE
jgi:ribosomal protein S18 acetylase RimI-like enzyme